MAGSMAGPGLSSLIELSTKGLGAFRQVGAGFDELKKKALDSNRVAGLAQKAWGGLEAGWGRVKSAGSGLLGIIGKLGLAGAVAGGAAAGGMFMFARGAIQASTEAENASAQLSTLYHSSEKAASIIAWLQDYAAKTPFEFTGLRDATVALEVYGLSAQKWIPIVADLAAGSTGDIVQAARAVAKATTGESEMLKELGVTSRDLFQAGAAGGAGQGLLTQTTEQVEALKKALETVIAGRFGGAVARFGTTLKALTSNISDFWSKFLRTIGGAGMFDKAKQSASVVLSFFDWLTAGGKTASEAADNMKKAGEKVADGVDQLLGRGKYAPKQAAAGQDVASRLDRIAGALSKIFSIPFKAFGMEVGNLTQNGGVIDQMIGGLERAATWLDTNWEKTWAMAKGAVGRAWDWITAKVDAGVAKLTGGVKQSLSEVMADLLTGLDQMVQRGGQSVTNELDRMVVEFNLFASKMAEPAALILGLAAGMAYLGRNKLEALKLAGLASGAAALGLKSRWQAEVGAQNLLARRTGTTLSETGEAPSTAQLMLDTTGLRARNYGQTLAGRRKELEAELTRRHIPYSAEGSYRAIPSEEQIRALMEAEQRLPPDPDKWGQQAAVSFGREAARQQMLAEGAGGP